MRFDFDPAKSATNKAKHGIDFVQAQALWLDPDRIRLLARRISDEFRFLVVGQIGSVLWTATGTLRDENQTIRIISVRRSRDEEKANYYDRRDRQGRPDDLG